MTVDLKLKSPLSPLVAYRFCCGAVSGIFLLCVLFLYFDHFSPKATYQYHTVMQALHKLIQASQNTAYFWHTGDVETFVQLKYLRHRRGKRRRFKRHSRRQYGHSIGDLVQVRRHLPFKLSSNNTRSKKIYK